MCCWLEYTSWQDLRSSVSLCQSHGTVAVPMKVPGLLGSRFSLEGGWCMLLDGSDNRFAAFEVWPDWST